MILRINLLKDLFIYVLQCTFENVKKIYWVVCKSAAMFNTIILEYTVKIIE